MTSCSSIPHHLDDLAESILSPDPAVRHPRSLPHVMRDPSLPTPPQPLAYTDVYVDDFVAALQCSPTGSADLDNRRQVRRLLLHAVDDVFHPVSAGDSPEHRKPVSLKTTCRGLLMGNYEARPGVDHRYGGNDDFSPTAPRCPSGGHSLFLPMRSATNQRKALARDPWRTSINGSHTSGFTKCLQLHAECIVDPVQRLNLTP
jgi:hypothetical protein